MKHNIECPTCQQAIELNMPAANAGKSLTATAMAILFGIIAVLSAGVYLNYRHDRAVVRNLAAINAMADPPRVVPIVRAQDGVTNWQYESISADDESPPYGLTFMVGTNELSRRGRKIFGEQAGADGRVELPEASLLNLFGDEGWELVSTRSTRIGMIWVFKRPAK